MMITLFHGTAGWTATALVAFALGTMTAFLQDEVEAYLERGRLHHVR